MPFCKGESCLRLLSSHADLCWKLSTLRCQYTIHIFAQDKVCKYEFYELVRTYNINWLCPIWQLRPPPPSSWPSSDLTLQVLGLEIHLLPLQVDLGVHLLSVVATLDHHHLLEEVDCSLQSTPSNSLVLLVTTKLLVIVLLHKVCNIDFSLLSPQHSSLLYKLRSSYLEENFSCFGSITWGSFFHYHQVQDISMPPVASEARLQF